MSVQDADTPGRPPMLEFLGALRREAPDAEEVHGQAVLRQTIQKPARISGSPGSTRSASRSIARFNARLALHRPGEPAASDGCHPCGMCCGLRSRPIRLCRPPTARCGTKAQASRHGYFVAARVLDSCAGLAGAQNPRFGRRLERRPRPGMIHRMPCQRTLFAYVSDGEGI
jgi:hypothetical protein